MLNDYGTIEHKNYRSEYVLIEKNKLCQQWITAFIASLGFFTTGICFLWSSPSLSILQSDQSPIKITPSEGSWIAAFLPVGCLVGTLLGAWSARHLGPKTTAAISSIPFIISFIFIILANSAQWFYASRFFAGLAVGYGQTASPIYIAEIAEMKNRGALMSLITFSMGIGGLFMAVLGPYLSIKTMAIVCLLFPISILVFTPSLPESPYFLMRLGREECAKKSLMWFRGQNQEIFIEEELSEIKILTRENMRLRESLKLMLSVCNLKKFSIVSLTFLAQNFSGAIVVMFFQQQIYTKVNSPIPSDIAAIVTASISNVFGLISLFFVDHWGRRPLLLLSSIGCAASTGLIGLYLQLSQIDLLSDIPYINWLPIVALNTLQIFFCFGLGPIPTTQLGEIFCSNVKEIAFCSIFIIASLGGVIVVKLFQIIEDAYSLATVFCCISIVTLILFLLMACFVSETRGMTLAEIQSSLFNNNYEIIEDLQTHTIIQYNYNFQS